ncbi:hypothetical protein FE257_006447 [Aspergillus nanangensis]|uniref:Zn(2)-C6 fungal-type domain-containing protein n=1 Tax=Aspergillus nanangensis TaxID=2582783 RepID=A0AAD4CXY2_ASPNN|nr:hypothetical protein FE257_006447 [Aspergillus nanangensis]
MSQKGLIPRNRIKTRTGCLRCKQRKIKCDETLPHCNQCTRRAYECPGYTRPLKWSSKYEISSQPRQRQRQRPASSFHGLSESARTSARLQTAPPSTISPPQGHEHPDEPVRDDPKEIDATEEGPTPAVAECSPPSLSLYNAEALDIEYNRIITVQDPDDFTSLLLEYPNPSHPLLSSLEDDDTTITRHYFTQVCYINSCFDSYQNTFRVVLGSMMNSSPLLYHCVLSMSAAHMAMHQGDKVTVARGHRTKATSCLTEAVMKLKQGKCLSGRQRDGIHAEALLGSIILGMTDAWHSPSLLGISHLYGARSMFKRWRAENPSPQDSSISKFIIGMMVYWEAIISFVLDQPLDAVAYLDPYCNQEHSSCPIHPNSWTGICTPMFLYLSKIGILARQRSLIRNLSITSSSTTIRDQLQEELFVQAREIETAVLQYKIPDTDDVEDTGDILTPVSHLQKMAQIYRFSALLELYRVFPGLLQPKDDEDQHPVQWAEMIHSLATSILTIILTVPHTSGVNCVLTIPLLIAGSVLQPMSSKPNPVPHPPTVPTHLGLASEILSISSHEDVRLHWRRVARERIQAVHNHVGITAVYRAVEILDKVWDRADVKAIMDLPHGLDDFIHWNDVMGEEKLETVLG